jgi:hypothetical protein
MFYSDISYWTIKGRMILFKKENHVGKIISTQRKRISNGWSCYLGRIVRRKIA